MRRAGHLGNLGDAARCGRKLFLRLSPTRGDGGLRDLQLLHPIDLASPVRGRCCRERFVILRRMLLFHLRRAEVPL